jgi:hypothetical protein
MSKYRQAAGVTFLVMIGLQLYVASRKQNLLYLGSKSDASRMAAAMILRRT